MPQDQASTPGPLSGDDVKLLVKGDWISHPEHGTAQYWPSAAGDRCLTGPWSFVGRPDADGWIDHKASDAPPPDYLMVEYITGSGLTSARMRVIELRWDRDFKWRPFRLAPPAPVEASGSEINERTGHPTHYSHRPQPSGETRELGEIAFEGWSQGLPVCEWSKQTLKQRRAFEACGQAVARFVLAEAEGKRLEPLADNPAVAALCESSYRAGALAGWNAANHSDPEEGDRIMSRIRSVEPGSLAPIAERNRQRSAHSQLSGETREAVAAGEIEVTDEMVLAALKARFGHESYALDEFNDPWRAQDNRDHMRRQISAALALIRPAPVASGGPHSSGEVACVIAFREGKRDPDLVSWNALPVGEHRLYTDPVAETAGEAEQPVTWLEEVQTADTTHSRRLFFGDHSRPEVNEGSALAIGHLTPEQQSEIRAHVAGLTEQEDEFYDAPKHGWTCFHCGQTFKTIDGAELHFGKDVKGRPVCQTVPAQDDDKLREGGK